MGCPAITPPCCVGCSQRQGLRKARFRPMVARLQQTSQNSCGMVKSEQQVAVVVHHTNRLRHSIAGTAAVVLATLPLAISPASAARVSQGTSSSIGVMVSVSKTLRFNLGQLGVQDSSPTGNLANQSIKIKRTPTTPVPNSDTLMNDILAPKPATNPTTTPVAPTPATAPVTAPVAPTTSTQQVPPP